MEVSKEDFEDLMNQDVTIREPLQKYMAKFHIKGAKYDFKEFLATQKISDRAMVMTRRQRNGIILDRAHPMSPIGNSTDRLMSDRSSAKLLETLSDNLKHIPIRKVKGYNKKTMKIVKKVKAMRHLLIGRLYMSLHLFKTIDEYYNDRIKVNILIMENKHEIMR